MARVIKVQLANGEEREAVELDFEIQNEQWDEYKLLDGGRVRMKTSALRMFRVLDVQGNHAYTPEGDPFILAHHNTLIVATE